MSKPKPKKEPDEEPVDPPRRQSSEVAMSPSVLAITSWTVAESAGRPLVMVVPGPTHFDRREVLKQYTGGEWRRFHSGIVIDTAPAKTTEWLEGNVAANFMTRVGSMPMPPVPEDILAKW